MRHYEIVLIIHPDQSEQVAEMTARYCATVEAAGGIVHRREDWGNRHLAYPIQNLQKGRYICFNLDCTPETLNELTSSFIINDAVIRHMVVAQKDVVIGPSIIMQKKQKADERTSELNAAGMSSRASSAAQHEAEDESGADVDMGDSFPSDNNTNSENT